MEKKTEEKQTFALVANKYSVSDAHLVEGDHSGLGQEEEDENLFKHILLGFTNKIFKEPKADVEKKTKVVWVGMAALQKEHFRKCFMMPIRKTKKNVDIEDLLKEAVQLLKCFNHPYLFLDGVSGDHNTNIEGIITDSGKMVALDKLLLLCKEYKRRVLITSQMTRMLDILEKYLKFRDLTYQRINENMDLGKINGEVVLLFSRKGPHIHLSAEDVVIHYDSIWKEVDLKCLHIWLCVQNTYEEMFLKWVWKKLGLPMESRKDESEAEEDESEDRICDDDGQWLMEEMRWGAAYILKSKESTIKDVNLTHVEDALQCSHGKGLEVSTTIQASSKAYSQDLRSSYRPG